MSEGRFPRLAFIRHASERSLLEITAPASLGNLLARHASGAPDRAALAAPGRAALTFAAWNALAVAAAGVLARAGVAPDDRLAVVLPSGPEMVAATVAMSSHVVLALLDPTSRERELERAFVRLGANGVVVPADGGLVARAVAERLHLGIIELVTEDGDAAGAFALRCASWPSSATPVRTLHPDVAFLAMTSGTTGTAKITELTEGNFTAAGAAYAARVALDGRDRALSVAATFHSSAMMTLAMSLHAGSGIVYLPSFDADVFASALQTGGVTWLVAPPATHGAALAHFSHRRDLLRGAQLRFVRSGAAPLELEVWDQLEELYAAPLLQSYGMTECPTISSCPYPARSEARGTVGLPNGCDLAILADDGRHLGAGEIGEVIVRGPAVTCGYDDPAANAEAFVDGWFRTGDLGRRDDRGYLTLLGRRKELINRGGQKLFPQEIEAVLREDAGIADVAVFSIPHPTLGEDVAAAVILQPGVSRSEGELRRFAAERVIDAKVPKRVAILERFPRTATGKVLRHELRALLEQTTSGGAAGRGAETILESKVLELFEDVLQVRGLGSDDDFFSHGGDSLRATRLLGTLSALCDRTLNMGDLFAASTPRALAAHVLAGIPVAVDPVVRVQAGTKAVPLFFLNGDLDGGGVYVRTLAQALDPERTVYSLPPHGTNGVPLLDSIEAMADDYTERIVRAFPGGPYLLGGYCNGGVVAFEVARRLEARNLWVGPVMLVAATAANAPFAALRSVVDAAARAFGQGPDRADRWYLRLRSRAIALARLRGAALSAYGAFALDQGRAIARRFGFLPPLATPYATPAFARMTPILGRYVPGRYEGPVHHFWGDDDVPRLADRTLGWGVVAPVLVLHRVPGDHFTIVTREAGRLAAVMRPLFATFD